MRAPDTVSALVLAFGRHRRHQTKPALSNLGGLFRFRPRASAHIAVATQPPLAPDILIRLNPHYVSDAQELLKLLSYCPETGVFRWKESPYSTVKVGSVAGAVTVGGYVRIRRSGKEFYAHRLAIELATGSPPVGEVDHINGIKTDNRLCNLRDVPPFMNKQNERRLRRSNTSGFMGVQYESSRSKWLASIRAGGRPMFLGRFDSPEAAHEAYLRAKRQFHPGCTI